MIWTSSDITKNSKLFKQTRRNFLSQNNHDGNGIHDKSHHDHVHIAYEGGGYVDGKYDMNRIKKLASYEAGNSDPMIDIPITTSTTDSSTTNLWR